METLLNSLKNIGIQFMQGVPALLKAIIIFIIGWIIAKMVTKALTKLLEKIKVDTLGEKLNEIDFISKANLDIKLSKLFAKVIYYVLMLFVTIAAADALGMPAVTALVSDIFNFIPNLIVALIVLIFGLLLSEAIRNLVKTALTSLGIPSANLISTFLFYFLFINVVVSALSQAKINTDFLAQNLSLIIGGVVLAFGLAYGLASKDIMANFLASFYSKDIVNVGDKIKMGDIEGEVISLDRSTIVVKTNDGRAIIPMKKISTENIEIIDK